MWDLATGNYSSYTPLLSAGIWGQINVASPGLWLWLAERLARSACVKVSFDLEGDRFDCGNGVKHRWPFFEVTCDISESPVIVSVLLKLCKISSTVCIISPDTACRQLGWQSLTSLTNLCYPFDFPCALQTWFCCSHGKKHWFCLIHLSL